MSMVTRMRGVWLAASVGAVVLGSRRVAAGAGAGRAARRRRRTSAAKPT